MSICEKSFDFYQGSKAVLVSRLLAAAPAAIAAPAPAPAPAVPNATPVAAASAVKSAEFPSAPAFSATPSSAAADDEAARLRRRMEKFGVPATAPATAASIADAERLKKRGKWLAQNAALFSGSHAVPSPPPLRGCCRDEIRNWWWAS